MRKNAVFAVLLLSLLPGAAGALSNPQGALQGQLIPASPAPKVPIRCAQEMQRLDNDVKTWKRKMTDIVREQKAVGRTVAAVGELYRTTPADGVPKTVGYCRDLKTAIDQVTGYMDQVVAKLTAAEACMWDASYKMQSQPGCYAIPLSCVDEGANMFLVRQSKKAVETLKANLTENKAELAEELPADFLYLTEGEKVWWQRPLDGHPPCSRGAAECVYTRCTSNQPVCRQHLTLTIDTFISAEAAIAQLY